MGISSEDGEEERGKTKMGWDGIGGTKGMGRGTQRKKGEIEMAASDEVREGERQFAASPQLGEHDTGESGGASFARARRSDGIILTLFSAVKHRNLRLNMK